MTPVCEGGDVNDSLVRNSLVRNPLNWYIVRLRM